MSYPGSDHQKAQSFPIGSQWRTRAGDRAVVVDQRHGGFKAWHHGADTCYGHAADGSVSDSSRQHGCDLVEPWREPKTMDVDLTVYFDISGRISLVLKHGQQPPCGSPHQFFAALRIQKQLKEGEGL